MRNAGLAFGLLALVPVALHAVPAAAGAAMLVPICTGDGQTRLVPLPGGDRDEAPPQTDCVKGCHGGPSRKRLAGPQFEPAQ
ncbi:MAG: hypothetical protein ACK442_09775 [Novosphingobium sp.]|jgi:hypothetical protein|nr:hypothetical protein [Novosphingobium sp.]